MLVVSQYICPKFGVYGVKNVLDAFVNEMNGRKIILRTKQKLSSQEERRKTTEMEIIFQESAWKPS